MQRLLSLKQASLAPRTLLFQQKRAFASAQGGAFENLIFNMQKEEQTLYQVLKVKSSSTQKEIKLAYYKMAKQYHPDFQFDQSEQAKAAAEVEFKKIHKAYEVLSNPISRQAYDIDNQLNQGSSMDSEAYQDPTTQSNYFKVRTQKDFYHTKWSNYEKPEWYHPYNGRDWRSEYLYTRREDEYSEVYSPRELQMADLIHDYRAYWYFVLFGLTQAYAAFKYWAHQELEKHEMRVLQSSFQIESQGEANPLLSLASSFSEEGDENDEDVIKLTPESAEAIRNAMEKYIKERQAIYSEQLDERVMQEQQQQGAKY